MVCFQLENMLSTLFNFRKRTSQTFVPVPLLCWSVDGSTIQYSIGGRAVSRVALVC
jgi:hypothetical protein